jgi:hypothetical protein
MFDRPECPPTSPLGKDVRHRMSAADFGSLWFAVGQTAVRTLDRALRSILGIVEFSTHEECVLRIALQLLFVFRIASKSGNPPR